MMVLLGPVPRWGGVWAFGRGVRLTGNNPKQAQQPRPSAADLICDDTTVYGLVTTDKSDLTAQNGDPACSCANAKR